MSLKSAPFYWLDCDAEDCEARCPRDDDETSAWSSADSAFESAMASEWERGAGDKHYCPDHAMNVCERCAKYDDTPLSGDRDYLCVSCFGGAVVTP